jgi:23S rRNA (guanosine2251-2'-O)-methyltransferase
MSQKAAVIFGIHAVESALKQRPAEIRILQLMEGRDDRRLNSLSELARNQGVAIERISKGALKELSLGRHQGAVAWLKASVSRNENASFVEADLPSLIAQHEGPGLWLVLDGVTDPHNLGACLRSADAAGVTAVLIPKDKSADITPVVSKVACGAAETVKLVKVTNLARSLETLKAAGIWVYGMAGEAEQTLYDVDLRGSVAIVMGAEGDGLRRLTRETCDELVKLPMLGSVSSLNVSVATGVSLYEVVRQRHSSA